MKCPDCDVGPCGGLNPPLTAILSTHLFMFSASHFQSVQELIVLQRAEKLMFSERQHRQKKKIYIRIVYGLALHEFSVVQSG